MNTQNFKFILSFVFLTFFLILSSGVSGWFDGLPWSNTVETLTLIIFIPCLFIIGRHFLSTKSSVIFLATLLILKLTLHLGAPLSGWKVRVAPNLKGLENGELIKTYFTIWENDVSAILKKEWDDKKEFPIDWFIPLSEESSTTPTNIVAGTLEEKLEKLSLWMNVEGVVRLPQGTQLIVLVQGTKFEELNAVSLDGEKFSIPIVHQLAEVKELDKPPSPARSRAISGKFKYLGNNWAFHPFLVDRDGNIKSIFENGISWQDGSALDLNDGELETYLFLGKLINYGFLVFLLIWFIWSIQHLWIQKILSTPIVICSLLGAVLPWFMAYFASLLSLFRLPYPLNPQYLAISIFLAGVGILGFSYWRPEFSLDKENNLHKKVFLLFAPALLSYFTFRWWPDLEHISLWTLRDDWTTYQNFSRAIVIEGQWLQAGEPVLHTPSQYRYIVAFFHWLFGPSAFSQRFSDIWFTVGTSIILVHMAIRFGLSTFMAFLTSLLFLCVAIGDLNHIGDGLAEYAAMFFAMFAGFILFKWPTNYIRVLIAGSFATIGFWLHLDRIGVAGGMACFLINSKEGTVAFVWKNFLHAVRSNWKFFAVYLTTLGLGLLAIILRNGFVGGHFGFVSPGHPNFSGDLLWSNWYLLLTGEPWPNFPINTMLLTLVLLPGTLLGLIALIWRPRPLARFPLSISIILLGLLSPYLFLHIWGYPPRYSTQLLPLAALSLGIIFGNFSSSVGTKKRA
ncbi:MAG: hypothetical protein HN668_11285 [Nitrospina sp.]|nr:hypothetical protein [Nitrospina sp.]